MTDTTERLEQPKGILAWITRLMEIDLLAAQRNGHVSAGAVERLKHHCEACSEAGACARMLAKGGKIDPLPVCPSRKVLIHLRDTLPPPDRAQALARALAAGPLSRGRL